MIARTDGTRQIGPDRQTIDLAEVMQRGITYFINVPELDDDEKTAEPYGLLAYPEPAQAGLGIADDMTLTLGVDGSFRLFQLQAVPAPEHFTPSSEVGAKAIVTREFLVVDEVPAWWAYGPHGRYVLGLLFDLSTLKRAELDEIGHRIDAAGLNFARVKFDVLSLADRAIAQTGRTGAARLARGYARAATYGTWERDSALSHAASLAGDLAHVLTVGDQVQEAATEALARWLQPQIGELRLVGDGPEYGLVTVSESDAVEPVDEDEDEDEDDAPVPTVAASAAGLTAAPAPAASPAPAAAPAPAASPAPAAAAAPVARTPAAADPDVRPAADATRSVSAEN
ncbi:MAG TPA: hypothetical protein VGX23_06335 [Actinocrinis sp.]|nr:hypothetical protein [Actinocrinis sp.]